MHYYFRTFDPDGNIYAIKLDSYRYNSQKYSQVGKLLDEGRTTASTVCFKFYPWRISNTNKVVKPMHVLTTEKRFTNDEILHVFKLLPPHLDLRTVNFDTYPELLV